jgi:hypothetical protein
MNIEKTLHEMAERMGIEWTAIHSVLLSISAAESVIHIIENSPFRDDRSRKAIEAARGWCKCPCAETAAVARAACDGAFAVSYYGLTLDFTFAADTAYETCSAFQAGQCEDSDKAEAANCAVAHAILAGAGEWQILRRFLANAEGTTMHRVAIALTL